MSKRVWAVALVMAGSSLVGGCTAVSTSTPAPSVTASSVTPAPITTEEYRGPRVAPSAVPGMRGDLARIASAVEKELGVTLTRRYEESLQNPGGGCAYSTDVLVASKGFRDQEGVGERLKKVLTATLPAYGNVRIEPLNHSGSLTVDGQDGSGRSVTIRTDLDETEVSLYGWMDATPCDKTQLPPQ